MNRTTGVGGSAATDGGWWSFALQSAFTPIVMNSADPGQVRSGRAPVNDRSWLSPALQVGPEHDRNTAQTGRSAVFRPLYASKRTCSGPASIGGS
jgi:hypothetical protein